jgi:hypothetical protein
MVHVSDSTIRDNDADYGLGVFNGIRSTLTVRDSTIDGNTNPALLFSGGGLYNAGTAEITESAITKNLNAAGGGIYNSGTLGLTNVTLSGNGAGELGGGIQNAGTVTLNYVTMVDNSSLDDSSISSFAGSVTVSNSVLQARFDIDPHPCVGITSLGHNISDHATCAPAPSDLLLDEDELLLGPLADNGGPTQTHALLAGSPAIDAADDATCPAADQRGVGRPIDGDGDGVAVCDIGAYEVAEPGPEGTPSPTVLPGGGGSPPLTGGSFGWPTAALATLGAALVGAGGLTVVALRRR